MVTLMTTCPDDGIARQIAVALVSDGLAACVQRIPGVQSTYVWKGELQEDHEVLLLIKTLRDSLPLLAERIRALHPYDVPELLVVPAYAGNEAYGEWVRKSVHTAMPSQSE